MIATYFLYKAINRKNKYTVQFINKATNRLNTINFGAKNYDDYTLTNNDEQKILYRLRHANDNINDLKYAGCWSMNLLWNKKTLEKSIIDMQERFNIVIVNNLD